MLLWIPSLSAFLLPFLLPGSRKSWVFLCFFFFFFLGKLLHNCDEQFQLLRRQSLPEYTTYCWMTLINSLSEATQNPSIDCSAGKPFTYLKLIYIFFFLFIYTRNKLSSPTMQSLYSYGPQGILI